MAVPEAGLVPKLPVVNALARRSGTYLSMVHSQEETNCLQPLTYFNQIVMMKRMIVLVAITAIAFIPQAMADVIYGQRQGMSSYEMLFYDARSQEDGIPHWNDITPEPLRGGPVGSGINDWDIFVLSLQDCPLHPGDWNMMQPWFDLQNPNVGVDFNRTTSLADSVLRTDQKEAIQTLINHVYRPMVDARADYMSYWNGYGFDAGYAAAFDTYDIYSLALQIAVWQIVREDDFAFWVTGVKPGGTSSYTATEADAMFRELIAGWLESVKTGIWDDAFATAYNYDVTVFAGDRYKSFFTVSEAVVPEPATMLMVGLGLAGLGLARRSRK